MIRTIVSAMYHANFDDATLTSLYRWQHEYDSDNQEDLITRALEQAEWGMLQVSLSEEEGFRVIGIDPDNTVILCSHATEIDGDRMLVEDDGQPHVHRFLYTDTPEMQVLFYDNVLKGLQAVKNRG